MSKKNYLINNEELMKEWNYEKNKNLDPSTITLGSNKKVWWKCKKGHEWEHKVTDRNRGDGCPYCSNRKILAGYNDLLTTDKELVEEWNYEKNQDIKPTEIGRGSSKIIWWKCKKCNGEWKTKLYVRTKGKTGCPYCAGERPIVGLNDLSSTNPELAKEWDYEKNGNLKPYQFAPSSNKKVWWKCEKGHEWNCKISVRNNGSGCPYCSNHTVLPGYNDLKTRYPEITNEWDYVKNKELSPQNYLPTAKVDVWWKCSKCGKEYKKSIYNKVRSPKCPKCKR